MIITNMIAGTIERIQQERQINYMAYYDMLTGLPNRTLFRDRLNQSVMLAERRCEIIAVIFLDLDSFKNVNDTIGYEGEMSSSDKSPANYQHLCANPIQCPVSAGMSF